MKKRSFYDSEFEQEEYDADDQSEFIPDLVFVAMPFEEQDMDEVYSAVKDECSKLGLKSRRVDENVGSGFIIKEIIRLIEDAEFIIFDLTREKPNVYYELGYAHGVGNEANDVLLIAKEDTKIHFDIAPFRVEFYRSTEHLRSIISSRLKKMMQATRNS